VRTRPLPGVAGPGPRGKEGKDLMRKASACWMVALAVGAWSGPTGPALAGGGGGLFGPNSDFPDANLVLPFDATSPRTTFFAASNVGSGAIDARWFFYDQSGELIAQVTRAILGEGGTDVVDVTRIANRSLTAGGELREGPATSLAGRRGLAVVAGNGEARLIGSFSIANTATSSAYGASAAGFGVVGGLADGASVSGTSFSPTSLQDNQLVLIGLNPASGSSVTSLTDGERPRAGSEVMRVTIELHGNAGDGLVALDTFRVEGSALVGSLQDLFPGTALSSSLSIIAYADEGADYSGSRFDPDGNSTVALIGFYGQALGPFGTGQGLRTTP
jgi:hypothetical protein